jgi:hypothetical protein
MRAAQDISAQSLPGIAYRTRDDAAPQAELATLANIYRFVLERKEAAPRQSRPDAGKEINESSGKRIIPE